MASIRPVTLIDRQTPAVSTVFNPRSITNGVGSLVASGPQGTAIGESVLSVSGRQTPNRRFKSRLKLAIPRTVEETLNGVPVVKVLGVSYVTVDFDIDPMFTSSDCQDLAGLVESALASDQAFLAPVLYGRENVHG